MRRLGTLGIEDNPFGFFFILFVGNEVDGVDDKVIFYGYAMESFVFEFKHAVFVFEYKL